jgi:uncharacterized protein YfaS (alpha-2-macroglobulin family)
MGLSEARRAGYPVTEGAITGAANYLRGNAPLVGRDPLTLEDWLFNREAFILYALAYAGAPDAARTAKLYEARARLNDEGRALLGLALHRAPGGATDPRVDTLINDLFASASTSATGTFWSSEDPFNWTTKTRSTSLVLRLLVARQPQSELIPNIVRYLVSARTADTWESTQETAWAVMALTDWMVVSGELQADYPFSVALNGNPVLEGNAASNPVTTVYPSVIDVADLTADLTNQLAITRGEGTGNLYYTARLRLNLPVANVQAVSNGVSVERRYVLANGETLESVDSARVGEVVQVRLTVVAPEDLHYVVIQDPIPAGTEAIDPNLSTNAQIGTAPSLESYDLRAQGWGWWWFSNIEYRDQQVNLYSTYLPAGTYEYVYSVRASVAGVYNVIPPTAQEFYFPDVYGRGAGSVFTVTP